MADPVTEWWHLLEDASRSQATLMTQTLREVNAPIVEALEKQRELQHQVAQAAEHLAALAAQMEQLTATFQAALDPYLRYLEWLGNQASPGVSSG